MSQKHSEQYKIIGQAIKKYRKQRGLTQEQLADRVSISISYLTKIEGKRQIIPRLANNRL